MQHMKKEYHLCQVYHIINPKPQAGFVAFWWTQYWTAQTGIHCMGPGVPISAKSNSWVVVLLHGDGFWRIQEARGLGLTSGLPIIGVSWPSGLAYRTQVLVLAAECGFESRPWHLCPWARHLIIIASLHPGVKWVPVRAELVD